MWIDGLINGRFWHARLTAQSHREAVYCVDILTILPFDNRTNCAVRVVICLCSRFFDRMDFLLTNRDIGSDRVFGADDVAGRVSTPPDGIPQLLLVLLHRLSSPIH
jgi:hypothetical protein